MHGGSSSRKGERETDELCKKNDETSRMHSGKKCISAAFARKKSNKKKIGKLLCGNKKKLGLRKWILARSRIKERLTLSRGEYPDAAGIQLRAKKSTEQVRASILDVSFYFSSRAVAPNSSFFSPSLSISRRSRYRAMEVIQASLFKTFKRIGILHKKYDRRKEGEREREFARDNAAELFTRS